MHVQDIGISSGGGEREISATVFRPDALNGAGVAFFPGYKSAREKYAKHAQTIAAEIGAVCLTVDISGHGETPGDLLQLKRQDLYDDAMAAYDTLQAQADVDSSRIGVVATSFGAYLAVKLSQHRDPKSLLLRAPSIKEELPTVPEPADDESAGLIGKLIGRNRPPDLQEAVARLHDPSDEAARLKAYLPREGLLRIIADYDGPITVVESAQDEHIDHKYVDACLAVAKHGTHREIKGAKHTLQGAQHLVYRRMILDWAEAL